MKEEPCLSFAKLREGGGKSMSELCSITDLIDMNLRKLQEIVEDKGAWYAVVHGVTKSQIRLSN